MDAQTSGCGSNTRTLCCGAMECWRDLGFNLAAKKRIMRILLCHNHYRLAGGEDQVYRDERWLLESHGHEVFSLVRHNDEIGQMSIGKVALRTLWNDESYIEVRNLIRRRRPDIVHC